MNRSHPSPLPPAGFPRGAARRLSPAGAQRLARACGALAILLALTAMTSCSIKKMAARSVANSLTSGPDVYATDNDPDLIRDAIPFGLKTLESLLQILPDHEGLLLAACRGYTQYAYAFVQMDADLAGPADYGHAVFLRERALNLYLRARDYGLRGLELRHKGITERLKQRPQAAALEIRAKELPMLYWTAAAWGSAISLGKDHPELVVDLAAVKALMDRGLQLDEGYDGGAIHEALIVLEALPPAMGGSADRAREHFRRAVELSNGKRASPYVTLAQSVSVMQQNKGEFEQLLHQALTVDPNRDPNQRLATIILQRKAQALLQREEEWFLDTTLQADTSKGENK